MRFVSFPLLNGEVVAFNVSEITLICVAKKGTRIFLKDGIYNDVQGEFSEIVEALNKSLSNIAE